MTISISAPKSSPGCSVGQEKASSINNETGSLLVELSTLNPKLPTSHALNLSEWNHPIRLAQPDAGCGDRHVFDGLRELANEPTAH